MNEKLIDLGKYIKQKRNEMGLTLLQLEKEYGVNNSNWSQIESGKLKELPKPDILKRISFVLEINVIELYKICNYLTEDTLDDYYKKSNKIF